MYVGCAQKAETELIGLTKRVRGLEEDFEITESKLLHTSTKLDEASQASDENERYRLYNYTSTLTGRSPLQYDIKS